MSVYLRDVDLRRLNTAIETCLTPSAFAHTDAWRSAVEARTCELLGGDHVVFAIPRAGTVDVHATNVSARAVETMSHLFARVPDIPADPVLNEVESHRISRKLEVWSRVAVYRHVMRGRRRRGDLTFLGEVLDPASMHGSWNIDFTSAAGHTALCVSFEGREARREMPSDSASALLGLLLPALRAGVASVSRRPDATTVTAWRRWHLTPREAEVAQLLARRATNSEIAAALGLSAHTVRHHVEHVFQKLGIRSRRQIAARLADG